MLTEIEFMGKNHIVLDKAQFTVVMQRTPDEKWDVISLPKSSYMLVNMRYTNMSEEEAYEYYRDRMQSYGFKAFPVLVE